MLSQLLVAIAVAGLLLCTLLLQRVRDVNRVASLKRHRSKEAGLADLLDYAVLVDDGVVALKNGSLMAAWEYRGEDNASSTEAEREAVSRRINQAVGPLGSGWMWHVDAIRQAVPAYTDPQASHFPDPVGVAAAIDEERRRMFEAQGTVYDARFVLTVTYLPPSKAVRKLSELVFDDDEAKATDEEAAQATLQRFRRDVDALQSRLSSVFRLQRLKSRTQTLSTGEEVVFDELLEYLQRCITGLCHPVRRPRTPILLDAVLGGQELWAATVPQIGRKYAQVVAIENFPSDSHPGMLSALGELAVDCRWSTRFIFLDPWEAVGHLERFRKRWQQQVVPFMAQVLRMPTRNLNEDALRMAEDAQAAKQAVNAGKVVAGYYTGLVVLMDEDRRAVEAAARDVEKSINYLGFTARIETINTLDAFFGSLPGHGAENVRRPLLNSMNLADLLPVSSIWTGEAVCPCPFYPPGSPPLAHTITTGSAPFRLNLHVQDLAHTLIFGPTKNGKSVFLAFVAVGLLRYPRMSVFCFDKGLSLFALCKAVGGDHYHVAGDGDRLAFCPLQHLEHPSDQAWAVDWIGQILRLNDKPVTPPQQNEIARSIENMHRNGHRTLTDFVLTVQDRTVRDVLKQYTLQGGMGRVFDADHDGLRELGPFTVFEIEELMKLNERYKLPILWYLFRRIERSLDGQPAAILLDEAAGALGHEVFRDKIKEWLRELRKKNCPVIMATQGLGDAVHSGILEILRESTATKIFLPNANASREEAAALYKQSFGLNETEIDILANAQAKRHYYLVSDEGRRLFELALGPLALAFLAVSATEDVKEVRRLEVARGEGWVEAWLARRGLSLSDYVPARAIHAEGVGV